MPANTRQSIPLSPVYAEKEGTTLSTYTPITEAVIQPPATRIRPRRILVVAARTASTPTLLNDVRARVRAQPCEVALLIPKKCARKQPDCAPEIAVPPLARAANGPVNVLIGHNNVVEAVRAVLQHGHFDEVIVSTLPRRYSRWLRPDLARRIERLGVPVTVVTAPSERDPWREFETTARVRAGETTDQYC
jgi:hypothetical protein